MTALATPMPKSARPAQKQLLASPPGTSHGLANVRTPITSNRDKPSKTTPTTGCDLSSMFPLLS
jgi:hypothetical protein